MIGKMAIVGNGDGIMVFKAAGVSTFPAENEKKESFLNVSFASSF